MISGPNDTKRRMSLIRNRTFRFKIGFVAALSAFFFAAWLPLGIFEIIPFVFQIPGESLLRSHAGLAVGALMAAAWGFWET